MGNHQKINYVEFPACDLKATKAFFTEYASFTNAGLAGGFFQSEPSGNEYAIWSE